MAREYNHEIDGPMNNIHWRNAVQKSYEYFIGMKGSKEYDIIDSYRADTDPDDWIDAPLLLSYQLINWATKKIQRNFINNYPETRARSAKNRIIEGKYVPELLTEEGLEQSQINKDELINQVDNAQILDKILHRFPRLDNGDMKVYRGDKCDSLYYQEAANAAVGYEMVINPFLSTSINPYVAMNFTGKGDAIRCIWEITIPAGQIFPYVSEIVPEYLGNEASAKQSEQEVLLPTRAILKFKGMYATDDENKPLRSINIPHRIYRFELIGFSGQLLRETTVFWKKTFNNMLEELPIVNHLNEEKYSKKRKYGGTRKKRQARKNRKTKRKQTKRRR